MANTTPLPKDFVVTRGLPCAQGGQWLRYIADHPVVWVQATVGQKPEDKPAQNRPINTNKWTLPEKQTLADLVEAVTLGTASAREWVQIYGECLVAVGGTARAEVESTEQVQRRLQEAKLILEGQGHRVRPDRQQQWEAVAATRDTMRVLRLTNNAQVRTLY